MTTPLATMHFHRRAAQRGLRDEVVGFILSYGIEIHGAGATFLSIARRRLPRLLRRNPLAERAAGWVLVLEPTGQLATCYRRSDAAGFLRRRKAGTLDRWPFGARVLGDRIRVPLGR